MQAHAQNKRVPALCMACTSEQEMIDLPCDAQCATNRALLSTPGTEAILALEGCSQPTHPNKQTNKQSNQQTKRAKTLHNVEEHTWLTTNLIP